MLGKIFGSDKVIEKTLDLVDDLWTSDGEEAADKREMVKVKTQAKVDVLAAYAPFKLAQRYIAFGFTFMFLFIMGNGVLGSLYGLISMDDVNRARDFADTMWLGEIMVTIVSFYFGGGLVESFKYKGKRNE